MNRHASTEELSAYVDSELGFAEARRLEAHCAGCAECGARLAAMRRVVAGLGRVERVAPPAALHQQIRRQVVSTPPLMGFRALLESFRLLLYPLQPALRTAAAMGLALAIGVFAYGRVGRVPSVEPRPPAQEVVETYLGAVFPETPTTSEVAGREFILTDMGWIQKGLEGKTPETLVDARSPRGRALLTKYSDLDLLLADGSAVVLRYNLETVEIRGAKILGYEEHRRAEGALAT